MDRRARALGVLLALAAAGVTVAALVPRCGLDANAEGDIIGQLKATEREGLSLSVPGAAAPLKSDRHHFDRITVEVDYPAGTAAAVATLDFDGKLGQTEVSSLGLEKIAFRYRDGAWKPEGSLAPMLTHAVARLEARRRALEANDPGRLLALWGGERGQVPDDAALRRVLAMSVKSYRVKAWYLRSERDQYLVSESYRLIAETPDRPVDEEGLRKLSLTRRGQELFFWPGLM